jgi:hypothetical protein
LRRSGAPFEIDNNAYMMIIPAPDMVANILAERHSTITHRGAAKTAYGQQDRHCSTTDRQIRQLSDRTAVARSRRSSIIGTAGFDRSKATADENAVSADVLMFNNNAGRNQVPPLD